MVDPEFLQVGDLVHYQPAHYLAEGKWENGVVKEIPDHGSDSVRVVYNCGDDWANYQNYTSALTNVRDLNLNWKHKNQ